MSERQLYRESVARRYAFFHYCDGCGQDIPSDFNNKAKVLGGHRSFCEATIDGKRQREEEGAAINDEEFQMMWDDDGGNGLGLELATSENDEDEEPALNQGYDSENDGAIEEEENEDGIDHYGGRSSDQDSGDEKEEREDHEVGAPPYAEEEEEEEEEEDGNWYGVNLVFYSVMLSL